MACCQELLSTEVASVPAKALSLTCSLQMA